MNIRTVGIQPVVGTLVLLTFARVVVAQPRPPADLPFVAVFVDAKTEARFGPFPFDRSVLASAIRRSNELGARGVALKFFLDIPRTVSGDRALAEAMKRSKVLLQAGDGSGSLVDIPNRFKINVSGNPVAVLASSGGLPISALLSEAHDLGFVDNFTASHVPVVERLGSSYVKSFYVPILELALEVRAHLTPGFSMEFGSKILRLDPRNETAISFPSRDDMRYIPLVDFLEKTPRPEVKDRVVIIGYDGDQSPTVQTPIGALNIHRAFYYGLVSVYRSLTDSR